jgi:hypothetical protein
VARLRSGLGVGLGQALPAGSAAGAEGEESSFPPLSSLGEGAGAPHGELQDTPRHPLTAGQAQPKVALGRVANLMSRYPVTSRAMVGVLLCANVGLVVALLRRPSKECSDRSTTVSVVVNRTPEDGGGVTENIEVHVKSDPDCPQTTKSVNVTIQPKGAAAPTRVSLDLPQTPPGQSEQIVQVPRSLLPPGESRISAEAVADAPDGGQYAIAASAPIMVNRPDVDDALWCEIRCIHIDNGIVVSVGDYYKPPGGTCPRTSPFSLQCGEFGIDRLRLLHEGDRVGRSFTGVCPLVSWPLTPE